MMPPDDLVVPGVRLERLLGRGASSTVYLGTQERFGRKVAVKVLSTPGPDFDRDDRFRAECRTLGHLSDHPAVVTVHDGDRLPDGTPYLVLAYLPGGTLADRIAMNGPTAPAEVCRIGVRLSGALESAHRLGVVHGDVKPHNVLWTPFGEPALVDFGVARSTLDDLGPVERMTPAHAAPELLEGGAPTVRSDVFALASTLVAALTGSPPERDDVTGAVVEGGLDDVPPPLAGVLLRALSVDPAERPATAAALGNALQECEAAAGGPVTEMVVLDTAAQELSDRVDLGLDESGTLPPPPSSPSRRTGLVALLVVLGGVLVAAAALVWSHADRPVDGAAAGTGPRPTSTTTTSTTTTAAPTTAVPASLPSPSVVGRTGGLQPNVDLDVPGVTSTARVLATSLADQSMFRVLDPGAVSLDYPEDVPRFPARVQFQFYNADLSASCPGFLSAPSVIRGSITKGVKWGPGMDNLAVVVVRQFEDVATARAALAGVALALGPEGRQCRALPRTASTEVDGSRVGSDFRVDLRTPALPGLSPRFDDYVSTAGANEDPRWLFGFKAVARYGTMVVGVATNTVAASGQVPAATITAMMNAVVDRLPAS